MSEKKKDTRPYWQQRRDLKLKAAHGKDEKATETKQQKKETAQWFGAQTLTAPSRCENCGAPLQGTINFHGRAHICHIVEKSKQNGCPSVATHPMNRWFGCLRCHTGYDDAMAGKDYHIIIEMKVWPIIVERFRQVLPHIKESELRRVPKVLMDAVNPPDA